MFGNPETTPGGRALKFYASVRLDVRGSTQIKGTGDQKDTNVGKETKIKVVKTRQLHHLRKPLLKSCTEKDF